MTPLRLALVAVLAVAAGCASTKLVSSWENPAVAQGPYTKLMIIALGVSPGTRAEFENSVADALQAHGVIGVSSTSYFSDPSQMTREAVRAWVEQDGYQGVLVTRLVDVSKTQVYQPPQYGDFYGYWGYYGTTMVQPGYVIEQTNLVIDTDLFHAPNGEIAYTAESKSFDPSGRAQVIKELTQLLVKDLSRRGLLPPKSQ